MANVLNKLLEICEILDKKGGSGGSSSGGSSSGISISKFTEEMNASDVKNTNNFFYILLGRYDQTKSKDLSIIISPTNEMETLTLYKFHIKTTDKMDSIEKYSLLKNGETNYYSFNTNIVTLTIDGEVYLALKIFGITKNCEHDITKISFYVYGTDDFEKDLSKFELFSIPKTDFKTVYKEEFFPIEDRIFFTSTYEAYRN